jgi:sec-independent protein translocase protein TatC
VTNPTRRRPPSDPEGRMSVVDHLRELRRRIILSLIVIGIGAGVAYFFYNPILHFLEAPYCHVPPKQRGAEPGSDCELTYFGVTTGFIVRLKICALVGVIGTAPFWLYQLWAFVTPGLKAKERKYTISFVTVASVLFALGMSLAYIIMFPGLRVLIQQAGKTFPTLTIDSYLGFLTLLLLVFGSAFELPLLIVMLNLARVLPYRLLRRWQRLSIFLIFVFAGVATPTPDPFTMCAMALPMVLLFEGAVYFAFVHDKRLAKRRAEAGEAELPDDQASSINPLPERLDPDPDPGWSSLP